MSPDLGDVWKNSPEWESDSEQVLRLKKTGLLAARGHPATSSCGPILGSCRTQVRPGHVTYCHLQVFTGAAAIGHGTADQRLQSLRKTSSAPIRVSFVFASLIPLTTSLERQPSPLRMSHLSVYALPWCCVHSASLTAAHTPSFLMHIISSARAAASSVGLIHWPSTPHSRRHIILLCCPTEHHLRRGKAVASAVCCPPMETRCLWLLSSRAQQKRRCHPHRPPPNVIWPSTRTWNCQFSVAVRSGLDEDPALCCDSTHTLLISAAFSL